jgi:hypothetical protein
MLRPAAIASVLVLSVTLSACGGANGGGATGVDPSDAQASAKFRLYYLGGSFHGLPLTDVTPGPGHHTWSFIYGDCDPGGGFFDEGGCAAPLEVQNWSACERHLARYSGHTPKPFSFRGAKAANISGFNIYTGRTTLVIYGRLREQAAKSLQAVGSDEVSQRLPAPVPGALNGSLPCQSRQGR